MIGFALIAAGLAMIGLHFFVFRVPADSVALTRRKLGGFGEGWNFGFLPSDTKYLSLKKYEVMIPESAASGDLIALRAPDAGVVGVALTVRWSHDHCNPAAYSNALTADETNSILHSKVRAALNHWIQGKPTPGTAKRAVASLGDAERSIRERLTGVSPQALVNRNEEYLGSDYLNAVKDIAIKILEINIVKMELLESGTNKPDWGDGDHLGFDAETIFKQFHAHTDNLSSLRKLKEALLVRYPDELDDIEDIYDQVRISMKENRER